VDEYVTSDSGYQNKLLTQKEEKMRFSTRCTITFQIIFIVVMVTGLGFNQSAWAAYPDKPINLIVGFKAGGITDSVARILAKSMQEQLGQPVLVVNKPGGGGFLAASYVRKSAPDGYNIAMTVSVAYTFMPHFMAKQKKVAFSWDDFDYLATVGEFQAAYVGPPSIKTWKELMDLGKQKKGLSVASMTPIDAMVTRYIAKKEGIPIKIVPFKGGAETLTAVMGEHTDFGFSGGLHIKYTKAGKLNTLAAFSGNGLAAEPQVPTLTKLGYDVDSGSAVTVSLPKGTPDNIIMKLETCVAKAVQTEEYKGLMSKIKFPINYRGPKATSKYISEQYGSMQNLFEFLK